MGRVNVGGKKPKGNATAAVILAGYDADTAAGHVDGSMIDRAGDTAALSSVVSGNTLKLKASDGFRDGVNDYVTILDDDWVEGNIKEGVNVFGKIGNYIPDFTQITKSLVVDTGNTISAGDLVQLINGKARKFNNNVINENTALGAALGYQVSNIDAVALDDTRIFIAYRCYAYYGYCMVIQINSDNTITQGTAVKFYNNTNNTSSVGCTLIGTDKVVAAAINGNYVYAFVCTVSGTTITVGPQNSGPSLGSSSVLTVDSMAPDCGIMSVSNYVVAFTVNGTTITFGTSVAGSAGSIYSGTVELLDSTTGVMALYGYNSTFTGSGSTYQLDIYPFKISGTTITINNTGVNPIISENGSSYYQVTIKRCSNYKFLIMWDNSYTVYIKVMQLDIRGYMGVAGGNSVAISSFGAGNDYGHHGVAYFGNGKFIISTQYVSSPYNNYIVGITLDGLTVTTTAIKNINTATGTGFGVTIPQLVPISGGRMVVLYNLNASNTQLRSAQFNMDAIGVAKNGGVAGQNIDVCVAGILTGLSGLTPSYRYGPFNSTGQLVYNNGFHIGTAIASDTLLIDQYRQKE